VSKPERVATLSEKLKRMDDARKLVSAELWDDGWKSFERELLERLLKCGPEDHEARYRLQIGIETGRHVRRVIESASKGEAAVQHELDIAEGRKMAPIA
jgi:uncharacterized protein (UPF0216 family)